MRPHHEITNIRELQPGQPLWGDERGAMAFYGVRGGWSSIATGYLLVRIIASIVCSFDFLLHGAIGTFCGLPF